MLLLLPIFPSSPRSSPSTSLTSFSSSVISKDLSVCRSKRMSCPHLPLQTAPEFLMTPAWTDGTHCLVYLPMACLLRACVLSHFSRVRLFEILWTAARQAPPSMGFSRQECWSGLIGLVRGLPPTSNQNVRTLSLLLSAVTPAPWPRGIGFRSLWGPQLLQRQYFHRIFWSFDFTPGATAQILSLKN